jgi:hypothetical protein
MTARPLPNWNTQYSPPTRLYQSLWRPLHSKASSTSSPKTLACINKRGRLEPKCRHTPEMAAAANTLFDLEFARASVTDKAVAASRKMGLRFDRGSRLLARRTPDTRSHPHSDCTGAVPNTTPCTASYATPRRVKVTPFSRRSQVQ